MQKDAQRVLGLDFKNINTAQGEERKERQKLRFRVAQVPNGQREPPKASLKGPLEDPTLSRVFSQDSQWVETFPPLQAFILT